MVRKDVLSSFPRPNVAVDIAVLTVLPMTGSDASDSRLAVLVEDRDDSPRGLALPGRFLRERQTIEDAVADALRVKAGLTNLRGAPRLLRVFDDPTRDPRAWTLSLAHAVAVPFDRLDGATGQFVLVDTEGAPQTSQALLFDHDIIVREAAASMRERYELAPDPDGLLAGPYTLAELRSLHEGVLGQPLRKDTFNRRMIDQLEPQVEPDGSPMLRSRGGRPAQIYVRKSPREVLATAQRRLALPREVG